MDVDDAQSNYRAEAGAAYLQQRAEAASEHVQSLRASLFSDACDSGSQVLDFGCGTGGVLSRLQAASKVGVEIGTEAAQLARARGIKVFESLDQIETDTIDVAISFHAVEHTENPAEILRQIARVVRPGGRVRLIVPGENPRDPRQASWYPNQDMHLYTWTPLIFGNLAHLSGLVGITTSIKPMPTASRAVRLASVFPPFRRFAHARVANRLNAWNVILDAMPPPSSV